MGVGKPERGRPAPGRNQTMADTGFPGTDAQFDFGRARRRRALSRLANRLRGEPSDVNLILPFEEVVEALGRKRRAQPRPADDRARLDRRHRGPRARVRPPLPADLRQGAHPLGADRRRAAPRRVDAADRRLPDRRAALREGRPPPRVGGARAGPRQDRRVRDRGDHPRRRRPQDHAGRPAAEEPRAAVLRAGAAARGRARAHPPQGSARLRVPGGGRGGLGLPRDAGARGVHGPRAGGARPGSRRSTSRWSRCCARPAWPRRPTRPTPTWRRSPCATCC